MSFTIPLNFTGGTSVAASVYTSLNTTMLTHDTLVVFVGHNLGTITSIVWNGQNLTKKKEEIHGTANIQGSIWVLEDVTGATSAITITFSASNDCIGYAVWVVRPDRQPLLADQNSSSQGTSGTTFSTGTCGTLTVSGEFIASVALFFQGPGTVTFNSPVHLLDDFFSGGTNNITLKTGYGIHEYSTTGFAVTGSGTAVNYVALFITLEEAGPEINISKETQLEEYTRAAVQVSKEVQMEEYARAFVQVSKVIQIIEFKVPTDVDLIAEFL